MGPLSISVAFELSHCGLIYFIPCLGDRVGAVCCGRQLRCRVEEAGLHHPGSLGSQPESGSTRAGPGPLNLESEGFSRALCSVPQTVPLRS